MNSYLEWLCQFKYNDYFRLYDSIFQLKLKSINEAVTQRSSQEPRFYLREYCTARINLGRQTGKTSFIKLKSLFIEKHLIIVPDQAMFEHSFHGGPWNVRVAKNPDALNGLNLNDSVIFVDEPSFCFSGKGLDDFYSKVCGAKCVMMLGE